MRLDRYLKRVGEIEPLRPMGHVTRIVGLIVEGRAPGSTVGSLCRILPEQGGPDVFAEVVGFRDDHALLMPLGSLMGVGLGSRICVERRAIGVAVGPALLGRVIDALGRPMDDGPPLTLPDEAALNPEPLNPMRRSRIHEPLDLGVRSLNALTTCGRGQRMGIFAGSGVGKSTLLGMIAHHARADVNVIALIGERGREVGEFVEKILGPDGLARSVVVAATSDESPLVRRRGAFAATAIAEYFRRRGADVLLLMDSVTRLAAAQREIGMAAGEPPAARGYTPSVFAMIPQMLERAGSVRGEGSITGLYTVLVDGDDLNDPIADTVRSILDGHVVLSREIAGQGRFPAVDVLASVSRTIVDLVGPTHLTLARKLRGMLATYQRAEDLIRIGGYVKGSDPRVDEAIERIDAIHAFLSQSHDESVDLERSVQQMALAVGSTGSV
ncbi:MAG: FliI/YscN family ATPase [Deltaproteobacteria bacterium]|nr:FliI/YscN family ATPase [Deltaproteobacteria bacterium]